MSDSTHDASPPGPVRATLALALWSIAGLVCGIGGAFALFAVTGVEVMVPSIDPPIRQLLIAQLSYQVIIAGLVAGVALWARPRLKRAFRAGRTVFGTWTVLLALALTCLTLLDAWTWLDAINLAQSPPPATVPDGPAAVGRELAVRSGFHLGSELLIGLGALAAGLCIRRGARVGVYLWPLVAAYAATYQGLYYVAHRPAAGTLSVFAVLCALALVACVQIHRASRR